MDMESIKETFASLKETDIRSLPNYQVMDMMIQKLINNGMQENLAARLVGKMKISVSQNVFDENASDLAECVSGFAEFLNNTHKTLMEDYGKLTGTDILMDMAPSFEFELNL